ncbi:MAG: hypothetical protein HYU66_26220 [Armatimonadetes bacterium]|nr:hypothetical protein [Armatimonadota bacterium]
MPPALRLQENRRILAGAREWGAPYVIWWSLAGTAGDNSLQRPAWEGGAKLTPWYWYYRAYHAADDPLVVEDFADDPHGPAGGDFDEAGYAVNRLGGRREVSAGTFACVLSEGPYSDKLYLRFGEHGGRWSTSLMHLDAARFSDLVVWAAGKCPLAVELHDGGGGAARLPVRGSPNDDPIAKLPLARFRGVKLSDLERLDVVSSSPGQIRLERLGFVAKGDGTWGDGTNSPHPSRAALIALQSSAEPLPVPAPAASRVSFVRLRPAGAIHAPKLNDVPLADELLPGQELTLRAGGTGHLRFGPLASLLDVKRPEQAGLSAHGLVGFPEYHSLQPDHAADEHWLEWHWSGPYPVRWFRLTLYGSQRTGTKAAAAMRYSLDQKTWQDALVDPREWDETNWVGRPPAEFQPVRELWLRFALLPDRTLADWPWTAGITDLRVDLTLDAERCVLPPFAGLEYRDAGPGDGYRGLLGLDG